MVPSMSRVVIEAIAEAAALDPVDLTEPLSETIDPDALETIFQSDTGHLTFDYHGFRVTVDHDQNIEVDDLSAE